MSYEDIGRVLGLTPEGVRQIEIRALKKLRRKVRVRKIFNELIHCRNDEARERIQVPLGTKMRTGL